MAQTFAPYDFDIAQGTTWADTIQLNDASGNAVDLTGFSAMMRLRKNPAAAVEFEASTANGKLSIPTPSIG
jgi:hypothetical protein